jgi:hypothetical protein
MSPYSYQVVDVYAFVALATFTFNETCKVRNIRSDESLKETPKQLIHPSYGLLSCVRWIKTDVSGLPISFEDGTNK